MGLAREQARCYLPMATYTTLIYQMDLSNFLKFTELRSHASAQKEVNTVADAMRKLAAPLIPTVSCVFDDIRNGVHFSLSEIDTLRKGGDLSSKHHAS